MNRYNILIIEDHKLMIEAYTTVFDSLECNFKIFEANNCDQAIECINQGIFDFYIVDLNIPNGINQNYSSGRDILKFLKKSRIPGSKIIICTTHTEYLTIYSLVMEYKPIGFLLKCDLNSGVLKYALNEIMFGKDYYSQGVKEALKKLSQEGKYLDAINRNILLLMNQGVKTKNLKKHVNLSQSAIDKRKISIRDFFGLSKANDEDILRIARNRNFLSNDH